MHFHRLLCLLFLSCLLASPIPAHADGSTEKALKPFLLGGIQTHEQDHERWAAALHRTGMNTVQATVYAHQGPWNTSKLWYHEDEPAVLNEIRTARRNGLQVVLVLRVALDHNEPENRFLWHGLTYPDTPQETEQWFRIYTEFVLKWARIAEAEGVEVLGIASEMNSLVATLPVDEIPPLAEYYLDDAAQKRLRDLVGRSEHLFTEDARRNMGAGDFEVLEEFLVERNQAERGWARSFTFEDGVRSDEERVAAVNARRKLLETHWRSMIEKTRRVYSGRLTLAANFDNYHEVGFWDALDLIGINAYFALRQTLETGLSETGLKDAWQDIFGRIDTFREGHELEQPVIFTELGYTRYEGVTVAPWSSQGFIPMWDPDGETDNDRAFFWASQAIEPGERALAMKALRQLWSDGQTSLAGVLYWKLSSQSELARYEPFMLYLGRDSEDPLLTELMGFDDGIRPLAPRTVRGDLYLQAVDAVVRDDLATFERLVDQPSANLPAPSADREPLLHLAVRLGRGAMARKLMAKGTDLARTDGAGRLALHWACYQQEPELVDLLLPPDKTAHQGADGETPLLKCARLDNVPVARRLLELGADVRATTLQGQRALHLAVDQASDAMVRLLIEHGADADAADEVGSTALHLAARRGDPAIVQALAVKGRGRPDPNGNRPAHFAAYFGQADMFQRLFEPSTLEDRNSAGQTLLHLAAYGGNLDILRLLLRQVPSAQETDRSSPLNQADDKGWTPIFHAVAGGHSDALRLLLEHGASASHRALDQSTALHHAAAARDSRLIEALLAPSVELELDRGDGDGNTALHHAAGWGWVDNVRLLLDAGADPGLRNRDDKTALDVADGSGRRRAALLLRPADRPSPP